MESRIRYWWATPRPVDGLCDEVNWVLEAHDALGPDVPLDPPPLASRLTSPVAAAQPSACHKMSLHPEVQTRAHGAAAADLCDRAASEVCDVDIRFTGPASVVALFRDVLDAFATPGAPRWTALEALLVHVITYWERVPRHHDPIFARNGRRCAVPACSSRRNLHDHHVQYRPRGGSNAQENRLAACAAHHLHCIHPGNIRAWRTAPNDVHWELGVRSGAAPLLTYVGDRSCGSGWSEARGPSEVQAAAGP